MAQAPAGLCKAARTTGRKGREHAIHDARQGTLGRGPQEHRGGVLGHPWSSRTRPMTLDSPSSSPRLALAPDGEKGIRHG